jgi:poly(hydroxyalkanoate) depolymerase family esterase
MKLSRTIRNLGRGIRLVAQIAKAKLGRSAVPSPSYPAERVAPVEPVRPMEPTGPAEPARPLERSRMLRFDSFGANPGRLQMLVQSPSSATGRPIVVLLHGCGQDATVFASDSGWTELADRLRFSLILPEQAQANNAGRCFQWFQPRDTTRDTGEAGSIAAMIRAVIRQVDADPARVFIVGLSAGGAMAAAMLAAYPDLFAAGASVAGLPVGAARSGMQAMMRMASAGPERSPKEWAALAAAAGPADFAGPWPRLSVWEGLEDRIVAPENGNLLTTQWCALHGLTAPAAAEQVASGVQRRRWPDTAQPLVEHWSLAHFPHAYPAGSRPRAPARFIEAAAVDATEAIGRFFGLD